jgi:cyanate permease
VTRSAALRWSALGLALGVNFGNAGPIANDLASAFDTGLGSVGLLTTALLLAHAASQLPAAGPVERHGPSVVAAAGLLGIAIANLVAAAAPGLAVLVVARVLVGCATGPSFVAGLEGGRQEGGALLAGVFGGAATLGIAVALAGGAALESVDASWRVTFLASAGLALLAILPLLGHLRRPPALHRERPRLGAVAANRTLWRLALLHGSTFGTSVVLGAWIVEYLADGGAMGRAAAGVLGALLLALTAAGRPLGGWLIGRGTSWALIGAGGAVLTGAGLLALVVSREPALVLPATIVLGAGLSLPFSAVFHAAVRAEPARAASASALVNIAGAVFALAAAPLVGYALDDGTGRVAVAGLAVLALLGAALNRREPAAAPAP